MRITTEDEARRAVQEQAARKVDIIKILGRRPRRARAEAVDPRGARDHR